MKKKNVIGLILGLLVLASMSVTQIAARGSGSGKTILKFGHLANEQHPWHLAALKFKDIVESKSQGKIEVQVYPNEQLGNELDLIRGIQTGVVDMTITGESMQGFDAPLTAMLGIPYLIKDSKHLRKAMKGQPGKMIAQQIEDKLGFYPLAYFERGPRDLTSNRPISKPSDLNGLVLRVPNVPTFVTYWQAAGAKPTPMAFSEVFTSLQQGTIDGQENPLSLINSANFYEVQKYVNETEHVIGWIYVVIGKKKLDSLDSSLKQVVLDAGKEMQKYEHELFLKSQSELRKTLTDKGMTFNKVDKAAFAAVADKVMYDALNDEQKEVYKIIKSLE